MQIYNNTDLDLSTLDDITEWELKLVPLVTVRNNYRERNIQVYDHPTDSNRVITIGTTFNGSDMIVVADEWKKDWGRELSSGQRFVTTN